MPAGFDEWMWLIVHTLSAIISLEAVRRMILPALPRMRWPGLITDVWMPLAIVLPFQFIVLIVNGHVGTGPGWLIFGAPAVALVMAVGIAMVIGQGSAWPIHSMPLISLAVGVLLLLLAAAHEATLWMGQCAFAMAALLLWINTPEDDGRPSDLATPGQSRIGVGVVLMLAASIAQGVAIMLLPGEWRRVAAAVTLASIVAQIAACARLANAVHALRASAWAVAYSLLFGLGFLSLQHLLPSVAEAMSEGRTTVARRVASGFGTYAWEATALLAMTMLGLGQHQIPRTVRRIVGAAIIFGAAALMAWRVSSV